jgi:hypothetical protein
MSKRTTTHKTATQMLCWMYQVAYGLNLGSAHSAEKLKKTAPIASAAATLFKGARRGLRPGRRE